MKNEEAKTVFPKLTDKEQATLKHIPFASFNDTRLESIWWTGVFCEESQYSEKATGAILVNLQKKGMLNLSPRTSKKENDSTFTLTDLAKSYIMAELGCSNEEELYTRDAQTKNYIHAPGYVASEVPAEEPKEEPKAETKEEAKEEAKPVKKSRKITVDFTNTPDAPVAPKAKKEKEPEVTSVPMSETQTQVIEELKTKIPGWDNGKFETFTVTVKENQLTLITNVTNKKGETIHREIFIGHNGGIRAYGKKEHSKHVKLMRAYDDVIAYGWSFDEA